MMSMFGGQFVTEMLFPPLRELERALDRIFNSESFQRELTKLRATVLGRPSPVVQASKFARLIDPREEMVASLWLKREDLTPYGGALDVMLGQTLLARQMGKRRVIAAIGGGQQGVAIAAAAAGVGLACDIYLGACDVEQHPSDVAAMQRFDANVIPIKAGSRALKDAVSEALRDWVSNHSSTYLCLGNAIGPHPFPKLIGKLQRVIGDEAYDYVEAVHIRPDALIASVGAGAAGSGIFDAFSNSKPHVAFYGVEAAGAGLATVRHAAPLARGRIGVMHGCYTRVLCDEEGIILESHSNIGQLNYPAASPMLARLQTIGRMACLTATDEEAMLTIRQVQEADGFAVGMEGALSLAVLDQVAKREVKRLGRPVHLLVCTTGSS